MDILRHHVLKKCLISAWPNTNSFDELAISLLSRTTRKKFRIILKLLGFSNDNERKLLSFYMFASFPDDVFNGHDNIFKVKLVLISKILLNHFTKISKGNYDETKANYIILKLALYNYFEIYDSAMRVDKLFLIKELYEKYAKYEKLLEKNSNSMIPELQNYLKKNQVKILNELSLLTGKEFKLNEQLDEAYYLIMSEEMRNNVFTKLLDSLDRIKLLLKGLVPNRLDIHKELDEKIDVELYRGILENRAHDYQLILNMIMFLFENMESLQARADDVPNEIWKNEILERLSWEDFYITIPDFIKGYIVRINKIYGDVNNLKKQFQNI